MRLLSQTRCGVSFGMTMGELLHASADDGLKPVLETARRRDWKRAILLFRKALSCNISNWLVHRRDIGNVPGYQTAVVGGCDGSKCKGTGDFSRSICRR
jgi:hypothetical protein